MPVEAGEGEQGIWVLGSTTSGEAPLVKKLTVTIEGFNGTITQERLQPVKSGDVSDFFFRDARAPATGFFKGVSGPVVGYTFDGIDPFEGTPLYPWTWPAAE